MPDPMNRQTLHEALETAIIFDFVRSSGPGGQNVNKVNTKVVARLELSRLPILSEEDRILLAARLASRITSDDSIIVQVQETRSQVLNRAIALEKMVDLIAGALRREKPRRATKPTRASKERRLVSKKAIGQIKKDRGRPGLD